MQIQLKELLTNDMLIALFFHLHKLATIWLYIPIAIASAERRVSVMKLIKNRLHNRLTELSLSNLMKIVIESPEKLTDSNLEEIVDMWNRKGRRIVLCELSFRLLSHYICILSLLMHFVKHLSTSIMNFTNTIFKGGQPPPCPPPPPKWTLATMYTRESGLLLMGENCLLVRLENSRLLLLPYRERWHSLW